MTCYFTAHITVYLHCYGRSLLFDQISLKVNVNFSFQSNSFFFKIIYIIIMCLDSRRRLPCYLSVSNLSCSPSVLVCFSHAIVSSHLRLHLLVCLFLSCLQLSRLPRYYWFFLILLYLIIFTNRVKKKLSQDLKHFFCFQYRSHRSSQKRTSDLLLESADSLKEFRLSDSPL